MSLSLESIAPDPSATGSKTAGPSDRISCAQGNPMQATVASLAKAFAEPFALVDVASGDLVHSDYEGLSCDLYGRLELLAEVSLRGTPEIVEEVAPLTMLAIPLGKLGVGTNLVAVGVFVNQRVTSQEEMAAAAQAFGVDVGRALRWSTGRMLWSSGVIVRMAETVLENLVQRGQLSCLEREVADGAAHADDIYAELDLLHRLTRHLHLSESEHELWRSALGWLARTIPARIARAQR